jgi:hypothetical protein
MEVAELIDRIYAAFPLHLHQSLTKLLLIAVGNATRYVTA